MGSKLRLACREGERYKKSRARDGFVAQGVESTLPPSTPASGNTGTCAGKTITGSTIRYKSKSGFHGKDSVSYKVAIGDRPPQLRVITINVK